MTKQKRALQRVKQNQTKSNKAPSGKVLKLFKSPRHIISIALTVAFILISVFCFQNSWIRLGESLRDIYTSLGCALTGMDPTVNKFSSVDLQDLGILPEDLPLFFTKLKLYGQTMLDKTTYQYYLVWLLDKLSDIAYFILLSLGPLLILALIAWILLKSTNNKYNQDTKPLQIVKFVADYTYRPLKRSVKAYWAFLKDHKAYLITWAIIWALNFNFVTIILEAIAYYYYFCSTFNLVNLYVQACKLLLDLSTVILFFPPWVWLFFVIIGFDIFRRLWSIHKLKKTEAKCEEIVAQLPISVLITGTMGTGKTTFLTELAITYNKYFRDVADKKMFEITMRFPNFPWINLERCIKYGLEHHTIYNLAKCKEFVWQLKNYYENPRGDSAIDQRVLELRFKRLAKKFGYTFNNFNFDYDIERYGFTYYDNLEEKTIFDFIETYAQLYLIYVVSCSLLFANYSIRVDDFQKDEGNFPLWDMDFFRNDPEQVKKNTRYAHILDFEALRIGTRAVSNSKFADSLDFGIIVETETGKENGNQKTVKLGYFTFVRYDKDGNTVLVTPETSLTNMDKKMARSRATVDNFPFVVFLSDEQRAASLNADSKELDDLLYLAKGSEYKFNTSFFALDELIYLATYKLMHKYHKADRYRKGNNTLQRHTLRNAFSTFIFKRFERDFNMYSVSTLSFVVQDGLESDEGKKMKYPVIKKKVHSGRFSTDTHGMYYFEKTRRSLYGIIDVPEFAGKKPTREELNSTNGFLAHAMDMMFPEGDEPWQGAA